MRLFWVEVPTSKFVIITALLLLLSIFPANPILADEGPGRCSMEITAIVDQIDAPNTSKSWTFILLQGVNSKKTYHSLEFVSRKEQDLNEGEVDSLKINNAKRLIGGNHYIIYDRNYSGIEEIKVGLLAIAGTNENPFILGYNSKTLTLNCKKLYPEKPGGISMLGKEEFVVSAKNYSNKKNPSRPSWRITLITAKSAYNPGKGGGEIMLKAAGVSLWLSLVVYLFLGQ